MPFKCEQSCEQSCEQCVRTVRANSACEHCVRPCKCELLFYITFFFSAIPLPTSDFTIRLLTQTQTQTQSQTQTQTQTFRGTASRSSSQLSPRASTGSSPGSTSRGSSLWWGVPGGPRRFGGRSKGGGSG